MAAMKDMIDYDPTTGLKTFFIADEGSTKFHIHYEQDVSAALEQNKREQNNTELKAYGHKVGWSKVAHIPDIVILEWKTKYGVDIFNPNHKHAITRLLNDPAYRYLRTALGRIGK